MKKHKTTLSALAAASVLATSAYSAPIFRDPNEPPDKIITKTMCLTAFDTQIKNRVYRDAEYINNWCDQTPFNKKYGKELGDNGCANGQIAIKEYVNVTRGEKFKVTLPACPSQYPPAPEEKLKKHCVSSYGQEGEKTMYTSLCDESVNNEFNFKNKSRNKIKNGCAEDQVAVYLPVKTSDKPNFKVPIPTCEFVDDTIPQPVQL
jgi:hypothetical protein